MVHRRVSRKAKAELTAPELEAVRRDIAEAFAFARFLIDNPKALKAVRDGSEIRIVPSRSVKPGTPLPARVQAFAARTTFRPL